jgi:hypothetical protein
MSPAAPAPMMIVESIAGKNGDKKLQIHPPGVGFFAIFVSACCNLPTKPCVKNPDPLTV